LALITLAFWTFWSSVAFIAYTYFGFPLLLALRAAIYRHPEPVAGHLPPLTVIIAAHNEAPVIEGKLANTLAMDYPADRLQIVVASDGSNDGTDDLVRGFGSPAVTLLSLPRGGKNAALNAAVATVTDPERILLFTDADTTLEPAAAQNLAAHFVDPQVGGVGGNFLYKGGKGDGERAYWSFDRWLKTRQSRGGSLTSATGQIYALRRRLFDTCPQGVADDFYISTGVLAHGKRLAFEPAARGFGPVAAAQREFGRKVRVASAGLRGVRLRRELLNPFRFGFYALQLLTHKVLRRVVLIHLLLILAASPVLWIDGTGWWKWFYGLATLAQAGAHLAALAAYILRDTSLSRLKPLSLPFYFDMVNIAVLIGLMNMIRGATTFDRWDTQRSSGS